MTRHIPKTCQKTPSSNTPFTNPSPPSPPSPQSLPENLIPSENKSLLARHNSPDSYPDTRRSDPKKMRLCLAEARSFVRREVQVRTLYFTMSSGVFSSHLHWCYGLTGMRASGRFLNIREWTWQKTPITQRSPRRKKLWLKCEITGELRRVPKAW